MPGRRVIRHSGLRARCAIIAGWFVVLLYRLLCCEQARHVFAQGVADATP
jgi:hypothetical protein